jgi:uncharacterized protein
MSNGTFVKGLYDAAASGNPGALIGALDPNIDWREGEGGPYASGNPYKGPQAVGGLLMQIAGDIDGFKLQVDEIIDGGDTVAVLGRYTGKGARTGKKLDAQFVHVWYLKGGKCVRWQQYSNTKNWSEVLGT